MEIEEYRPEPARSVPPEPPRKDRSVVIMSLIFVMTFLVTLAIAERHQLADYARQHFAESPVPQAVQPSRAANVLPSTPSGQKIQGNVERAMNCIPANVLSAAEIEQLNAAIAVLPASSLGTTTKALSANSFDPHKMTPEQARETLQILVRVRGPLGDKALQALNQSISEGPCKIHPDDSASVAPATPPPHAPSAAPATG